MPVKTLFLNPNSSERVTGMLAAAIHAAGGIEDEWEVRQLSGAPDVIASPTDNRIAQAAAAAQLPALAEAFDRVVLMSSLDTGYAVARQMLGHRVFGFTRSVLAQHRERGQRVQAITFGEELAPLYEEVFTDQDLGAIVQTHAVCATSPLALAHADAEHSVRELAAICERVHAASGAPVFVVGAVVLELAARVRQQGRPWIVDPIGDLLAFLDTHRLGSA